MARCTYAIALIPFLRVSAGSAASMTTSFGLSFLWAVAFARTSSVCSWAPYYVDDYDLVFTTDFSVSLHAFLWLHITAPSLLRTTSVSHAVLVCCERRCAEASYRRPSRFAAFCFSYALRPFPVKLLVYFCFFSSPPRGVFGTYLLKLSLLALPPWTNLRHEPNLGKHALASVSRTRGTG